MSGAREREKAAQDRASVSADRAEEFSKRLDDALKHLKVVHLAKEDLSHRLSQSLSMAAEQREEVNEIKGSLAAVLEEIKVYKSQVESLEKEVRVAKDESKSVFSLARLTARAAIMRRHLRGKTPLASAKEELDLFLNGVGSERDLDSDDEKEEEEGDGLHVEIPGVVSADALPLV